MVKVEIRQCQQYFFEFFALLGLVFQVLKVCPIKICKTEPADHLFLITVISFYISRYHFSKIFRTSFRIIRKKYFHHKFSFSTDSLSHPPPLRDPSPLHTHPPLTANTCTFKCKFKCLTYCIDWAVIPEKNSVRVREGERCH